MRHANILAGSAFRSAIWTATIVAIVLFFTGILLFRLMNSRMYSELENQLSEEVILFQTIGERDGRDALVSAISRLEDPIVAAHRVVALYDQSGNKLSGNLQLSSAFLVWGSETLRLSIKNQGENYRIRSTKLTESVLVIGRSTRLIDTTLAALMRDLLISGILITLAVLLIGYYASRRSFVKLDILAGTLDELSQGKTDVRVPVTQSNDQIDRIARRINAYLENLSTLMDSTRNTVNSIAHDLRTPLNRVYILLQDAQSQSDNKEKVAELIDQASVELLGLSELFDSILQLSKIESNSDRSTYSIFPINVIVAEMAEVFEPVITAVDQRLICSLEDLEPILVFGDKRLLRQLLVNLIENASRHSTPHSSITISVSTTISGGACIEISDTGPGIPPEQIQNVIKPFVRLDASRSTPGTGLGLALVNAVVTRHGATMQLLDNLPGLRVRIEFPPIDALDPLR